MSDSDSTVAFSAQMGVGNRFRDGGPPHVIVRDEGRLQIYPSEGADLALFFGIADWRKLNATVEAAIEASNTAVEAAAS